MLVNPLEHLKASRAGGWGEVEDVIRAAVEARIHLFGSEGETV